MVTVRVPTLLRRYTGGRATVHADGGTIKDVFVSLEAQYPGVLDRLVDAGGGVHRFVNVFAGDDDVRYLEGLATSVEADEEITILPAVSGGGWMVGTHHLHCPPCVSAFSVRMARSRRLVARHPATS
jgi:molybdopterin synthase sulfur carrier subunit